MPNPWDADLKVVINFSRMNSTGKDCKNEEYCRMCQAAKMVNDVTMEKYGVEKMELRFGDPVVGDSEDIVEEAWESVDETSDSGMKNTDAMPGKSGASQEPSYALPELDRETPEPTNGTATNKSPNSIVYHRIL